MKFRIVFIALLIGNVGVVAAQNELIDNLEKKLRNQTSDSARVGTLIELVFNTKFVDTLKARTYCDEALTIVKRNKSPYLTAAVYRVAGVLEETHFKHSQALTYFYNAQALIQQKADAYALFLHAVIQMEIGSVYLYQANLSSAISYYFEALDYFEKEKPEHLILVFLYNNLSTTYALAGQLNKAFDYSKKSVALAEHLKDKRAIAYAYSQHGLMLIQQGDLEEGYHYNERARALADLLNDYSLLGENETHLALYHQKHDDLQGALEHAENAIAYYKHIYRDLHIGELYDFMGANLNKSGAFAKAKKYFEHALVIAGKVNCAHLKRSSLKHLSDVSERLKDFPQAMNYYRKYLHINDSLMRHDEKTQIFIAEAKFETGKQQARIILLEKEKQLQSVIIQDKNFMNLLLLGGIIGIVVISVLAWINIKRRQQLIIQHNELQQQRIHELEKDKQLVAVESMLKGQEEERSRLAKDIHDGLGSMLSSVKHNLTSIRGNMVMTGDSVEAFNKSVNLIDYSMQELRRVAHNMMPEALIRFGLNESLYDFCQSLSGNQLQIKYISLNAEERFDSQKEIVAYRIVQELITNILRHAAATQALVQLSREENLVTITVEDNGKGFDLATLKNSKGAGWTNIYSRAEYLKGKIEVDSKPGSGTSVTLEFYV